MSFLSDHRKKTIEYIYVIIISTAIAWYIIFDWTNDILNIISSLLFKFFLPVVSAVIIVTGGFHEASEYHVVIGVILQMLLLWFILKFIIKFTQHLGR